MVLLSTRPWWIVPSGLRLSTHPQPVWRPIGVPEAYHLGMHRIRNEGVAPDFSDGSVAVELFLRQEPGEDEDEEDEDDRKDDDDDDDEGTDGGYSE
jgi:hypothetical protein